MTPAFFIWERVAQTLGSDKNDSKSPVRLVQGTLE